MDWGEGTARENLRDYQSDMDVLISHINAARSVAVGLYNRNPDSHSLPSFDELYDTLSAMSLNFRNAKKIAKERMGDL